MNFIFNNLKFRWFLLSGILGVFVFLIFRAGFFNGDKRNFLAALFFPESITFEELKNNYKNKKLSVLIVPGHDDETVGTEFKNIKEADLTLAVSKYLYKFLDEDPAFQVFTTRETGNYTATFQDFFKVQESAINDFKKQKKQIMQVASQIGFEEQSVVFHNNATADTAFKLYGINKWANDNGIDVVLNLHFNDYSGRRISRVGEYSGFSVYIPDKQLPNGKASVPLANSVFNQLNTILSVSDLPQESAGIIADQKLIAIGANTSLNSAALLIEYGYIYESAFRESAVWEKFAEELAYQTYLGLKRGLDNSAISGQLSSKLLPYKWNHRLISGMKGSLDVLALQMALAREGLYPPPGRDCPVSSNFLECTEESLKLFQEKYAGDILQPIGLTSGTGIADKLTLQKLNVLYGL